MKNNTNENTELHVIRQLIGVVKNRNNLDTSIHSVFVDSMTEDTMRALESDGYKVISAEPVLRLAYETSYIITWA